MKRWDDGLAFLLKYENVAWYKDESVQILDRRVYPRKVEYVKCFSYQEVSHAIKNMVTQSGGPYLALTMGMVLAAKQSENLKSKEKMSFLEEAAFSLSHARPTTSTRMKAIAQKTLEIARQHCESKNLVYYLQEYAIKEANERYLCADQRAQYLADKISDGDAIMTQCFPDAVIGMICRKLETQNKKNVVFYCPETRPYFQGSRLTASVIADMGFTCYVITDNMIGITLERKDIKFAISAADMITLDGHVINKIGTFNIALAARYFQIPYYCLGVPNKNHKDCSNIEIEERAPEDITYIDGQLYTLNNVSAYYPLFDITPPSLVSGIITEKGIYQATDLKSYFNMDE